MDAQTVAVWLIAAGALVIVLGLVAGAERPHEGISFRGPLSTRAARLRFAVEATGAALVAAGSVLLAVTNPPDYRLLVLLPIAYGLTHLLAAWKLRQYWQFRHAEALRALSGDSATALQRRMARCAAHCVRWRWCLRHPFNDEYWPRSILHRGGTSSQTQENDSSS